MGTEEKTVFITGANRGIGLGMVLLMAGKDYRVFAGYREEARSERLFEKARQDGRILPVKVDVTRES